MFLVLIKIINKYNLFLLVIKIILMIFINIRILLLNRMEVDLNINYNNIYVNNLLKHHQNLKYLKKLLF